MYFRENKTKRATCKQESILPINSPRIETCNTAIYIFNIRITVWMFWCVTRGGEWGEVSPALFQKLEESALILGINTLIVSILG